MLRVAQADPDWLAAAAKRAAPEVSLDMTKLLASLRQLKASQK